MNEVIYFTINFRINEEYVKLVNCIFQALHLILSGFKVKRIKKLPNDNLHEHTSKV